MPIRDRITWGPANPFADPRLFRLDEYVRSIRQGQTPPNVKGGRIYKNEPPDLPHKPLGYYREYDIEPKVAGRDRGKLRLILGNAGEVYITGDHYGDFRQIINMPT